MKDSFHHWPSKPDSPIQETFEVGYAGTRPTRQEEQITHRGHRSQRLTIPCFLGNSAASKMAKSSNVKMHLSGLDLAGIEI